MVLFSLESLFNTWFTLELVLRFISCDKKLAFVKNWLNIIDLIAILPYYLMLTASKAAIGRNYRTSILPDRFLGASTNFGSTLKIFRLTRIVRVAKIRFSYLITFGSNSLVQSIKCKSYRVVYIVSSILYGSYDMGHLIKRQT